MRTARFTLACLFLFGLRAQAHVGSPDVFLEGNAGPYQLFVTVRPPPTIPGIAELEVRCESPGVREIRAVPLSMSGAGAKFAPLAEPLKVSSQDSQFFTGSVWMMVSGSWQIRLTVEGERGQATLSVPVPSMARASKNMDLGLGMMLSVLGLFLVGGLVAMIGAGSREAQLAPGVQPASVDRRRGRIATGVSAVVVIAIVVGGKLWWNSEAADYDKRIYKPLQMDASLEGTTLALKMREPGWMQPVGAFQRLFTRKMDDFIPDHGHVMHLYVIRQPGLDVIYHLHPELAHPGIFQLKLPSTVAGRYRLYADVVHENGFPETMVSAIDLPALNSRPLSGDDASAATASWQSSSPEKTVFTLPDGYQMEWLRGPNPVRAGAATAFRFRLITAAGAPPADMALYMGMPGHAAFVKTDGTVFAHIHPNGSVSMAALMLAAHTQNSGHDMDGMDMASMAEKLPNVVAFPYAFPSSGRYRVFVQMKHGGIVETGVFDALVN